MSLQVVNVFCRFNSGSTSDCDYCLMWDYISVIFREFEVMWGHSSSLWEYLCQVSRSFPNIFKVRELLVLITTGTNVHVVKLHKLMHDQLMPSSSLLGVTTMVVWVPLELWCICQSGVDGEMRLAECANVQLNGSELHKGKQPKISTCVFWSWVTGLNLNLSEIRNYFLLYQILGK